MINPTTWYNLGTNQKPNLLIGGVSSTINTKEILASTLGVSVSVISKFKIVGSNLECFINRKDVEISFSASAFSNNSQLTYFKDLSGCFSKVNKGYFFNSCTELLEVSLPNATYVNSYFVQNCINLVTLDLPKVSNNGAALCNGDTSLISLNAPNITYFEGCFINCNSIPNYYNDKVTLIYNNNFESNTSMNYCDLPNLTTINFNSNWKNCTSIELINIPKCNKLGDSPSTNTGQFTNIKTGCVINVNISLQTANAGSPDADLQYAISSRGAIVNYIT